MDSYTPFCGNPPIPSELFTRWTFEPVLIAGLILFLAAGLQVVRNRPRFGLVWALVTVLFVSPLCAASMALFSARVAQHIILTLIAAPLLASALPRQSLAPMPLAVVFGVLFWFWHAPAPYQATLESDLVYWTMHISLFSAAVALFAALRNAPEKSVLGAIFTAAQLTLFAMVLTLAPAPWHEWHVIATLPYGVSALEDQQLAGALMWVAGGGVFMVLMAGLARRFLYRMDPSLK